MATITSKSGLVLPTLTECEERARLEVRNKIPEADLSNGADYDLLRRIMGADTWQHFQPIGYVSEQIFPETADTPYLVKHGRFLKIPRPGSAAASGHVLLLGVAASTQGAGSVVTTNAGIGYTMTGAATIITPAWTNKTVLSFDSATPNTMVLSSVTGLAVGDPVSIGGGTYVIKDLPGATAIIIYGKYPGDPVGGTVSPATGARAAVLAIESGASGNAAFGDEVTLATPAAGVQAIGYVLEASGGADEFTDELWAILMQDIRSEYPAGGNRSQLALWGRGYDETIKAWRILGVERCIVYPRLRGPGTIDLRPQGIRRARHLSGARITDIQNYVAPAIPDPNNPGRVAPGVDVLVADFTDQSTDVSVAVQGGPGYGPDWVGSFTVAGGGTTTRIPLTSDPRGTIVIGNRAALRVGVAKDLLVVVVDGVDAGGISVNPALPVAPTAGETIYPGSSLIEPVRDAILAVYDSLGTGDTSPPTRWPPPTDLYPANLDRALLIAAVRVIQGVNNLVLNLPVVDVIPAAGAQAVLGTLTITHI